MKGKLPACALALALMLCFAPARAGETAPELLDPVGIQLDTALAERGELYEIVLYPAEVICETHEMSFTVDGQIERINVCLGDEVKAGDVLCELDETDYIEEKEALEEQLEHMLKLNEYDTRLAEMDIKLRETELIALSDGRADADPQKTLLAVREAQADIEAMRLRLTQNQELFDVDAIALRARIDAVAAKIGRNQVLAPCDGRVVFVSGLEKGDWVQAYDTVLCVADRSRPLLKSEYISQTTLSGSEGLTARIGAKEYAITAVEPDLQENITKSLRGIALTSTFTLNEPDADAETGLYAAILLKTRYVADALSVPANALYTDAAGRYVYVVKDGVRTRRTVRTGITTSMRAEIVEGLEEGEQVYVKE